MRTQEFLDKHYLRLAFEMSKLSYAVRRKVGCVIVKDRQIISDGYNGTPSGFPNDCETLTCSIPVNYNKWDDMSDDERIAMLDAIYSSDIDELRTKPEVLHAEANAITKLAKSTNSSVGATIYVTDEPCFECSKLIIQSGIKRVVYWREYHKHEGIELLNKAGIEVVRYDKKD